jgi:hypothetical protein
MAQATPSSVAQALAYITGKCSKRRCMGLQGCRMDIRIKVLDAMRDYLPAESRCTMTMTIREVYEWHMEKCRGMS